MMYRVMGYLDGETKYENSFIDYYAAMSTAQSILTGTYDTVTVENMIGAVFAQWERIDGTLQRVF